jgi:putative hydrolase of the HAD superfamily
MNMMTKCKHIVFDWGDTLMKDDLSQTIGMYLWPEVHAIAGAERTLRTLSRRFAISVATNAAQSDGEMVRKALRRVGLDQYVSSVFTARTVGRKKTAPEFWIHIQRELKAEAGEVLVVGDSFESDVCTPVGTGLTAIWFNPSSNEERSGERHTTIHTLTEMIQEAEPNAAPLPSEGVPSEGR